MFVLGVGAECQYHVSVSTYSSFGIKCRYRYIKCQYRVSVSSVYNDLSGDGNEQRPVASVGIECRYQREGRTRVLDVSWGHASAKARASYVS